MKSHPLTEKLRGGGVGRRGRYMYHTHTYMNHYRARSQYTKKSNTEQVWKSSINKTKTRNSKLAVIL